MTSNILWRWIFWILVSLSFLTTASSGCSEANYWTYEGFKDNGELQCEVLQANDSVFTTSSAAEKKFDEDVMVQVVDSERGVVRFVMPLLKNASSHEVRLYVCSDNTSENCLHSVIRCQLKGTANQTFYVQLSYVYSGRYEIRHYIDGKLEKSYIRDITTKHKKTDFKTNDVIFSQEYNQKKRTENLMFEMSPVFLRTVLGINFYRTDFSDTVTWFIYLDEENDLLPLICSTKSSMKPLNCSFKKIRGQTEKYSLRCPVENMTIGSYNCSFEVKDARCNIKHGVWSSTCGWNTPTIEIEEKQMPMVEDKPKEWNISKATLTVLLPIVVVICLSSFIYFVLRRRERRPHIPLQNVFISTKEEKQFESSKCKILLVYAQDCQRFMDMMSSFRILLETTGLFEVYDYFDQTRFNEIAVAPEWWITQLLLQEDVKVILVENATAVYHQDALCKRAVIHYSQQKTFSNLFPYALQALMQDVERNEYKHTFIVRFDDVSPRRLTLARFQRFLLPKHITELLYAVKESGWDPGSANYIEAITEDMKSKIEEYRSYCIENPNYHKELFSNAFN